MPANKEIERRFLLRKLPELAYYDILNIHQDYCVLTDLKDLELVKPFFPELEITLPFNFRLRIEARSTSLKFVINHKIPEISEKENIIINKEHESEINGDFYNKLIPFREKGLRKTRYVFHAARDEDPYKALKWEIDVYAIPIRLVIAEIEIPNIDYPIALPDYILNDLLLEVTALKQFSNYNLALK